MNRYRYETERKAFIARALPNLSSPTRLKEEKKIVFDLFEKYPEMDFWRGLKLPFEMESLTYFFGPRGQAFLRRQFNLWKFRGFVPKIKPELSPDKIGPDYVSSRKPKTIREFIK